MDAFCFYGNSKNDKETKGFVLSRQIFAVYSLFLEKEMIILFIFGPFPEILTIL